MHIGRACPCFPPFPVLSFPSSCPWSEPSTLLHTVSSTLGLGPAPCIVHLTLALSNFSYIPVCCAKAWPNGTVLQALLCGRMQGRDAARLLPPPDIWPLVLILNRQQRQPTGRLTLICAVPLPPSLGYMTQLPCRRTQIQELLPPPPHLLTSTRRVAVLQLGVGICCGQHAPHAKGGV